MITYREFVSKHLKGKKFETKHERGMAMRKVAEAWHEYKAENGIEKKMGRKGKGRKKKGRGPIGMALGSIIPSLFSKNPIYPAIGTAIGAALPF
jgi:hypothetical protein